MNSVDNKRTAITPSNVAVSTPRYVLMNGSNRIGPEVVPWTSGHKCSVIHGFSDKSLYDRFSLQSELALAPYPLVRGYLRGQLESGGDSLALVAIDAAGVDEPCLQAATMEAVLDAQESKAIFVTAKYRLVFDPQADAYRVDEVDCLQQ